MSEGSSSDFSYTCPQCQIVLQGDRASAGERIDCSGCAAPHLVPRPKLSLKGELPVGRPIVEEETQEKAKLSLSRGKSQAVNPVGLTSSHPINAGAGQTEKPGRKHPGGIALGLVVFLVSGAGWYIFDRTDLLTPAPKTIAETKPSQESVLNLMDLIHRRLQKVQLTVEILESDTKNLTLLKEVSGASDEMSTEEAVFTRSLETRKSKLAADVTAVKRYLGELDAMHTSWPGYMDDLLEQSVEYTESEADHQRAFWYKNLTHAIQSSDDPWATLEQTTNLDYLENWL